MARILIVEDDRVFRLMLTHLLTQAGHEVHTVDSGLAAARRILREPAPFDLLVTDIVMPDMDGLELVMLIRRMHPAIRIIAISGGLASLPLDLLPMAAAFGADATLKKPFGKADVAEMVTRVLDPQTGRPTKNCAADQTEDAVIDLDLAKSM